MGSGNSRLNSAKEGDVLPPKARSTLLGRFDEFRKSRHGAGGGVGNLSKKQLLKDAEDGSSHESETEDNKVLVPKETESNKEETLVKVITTEKLSRVVPMPNIECETGEEKDPNKGNIEHVNVCLDLNRGNMEHFNEHLDLNNGNEDEGDIYIDPKQGKVIHVHEKVEAEVKTEVVHVDEKDETEVKTKEGNIIEPVEEPKREIKKERGAKSDDDSDGDQEDEELGRFLCPGSPSFRIYYIEAEKIKDAEECKSPTIVMHHQKSRSVDSVASSASRKLRNSNDVLQVLDVEIESTTKGKGKKSKKFGPMKKLLKVKSCYHPMCTCTGDDRTHLIAAKATH